MRLFALGDSRELGGSMAAALGRGLDPHEERDFEDGEHKARPLVGVRGRDVYVLHALGGGGATPNDRLVKLLFFVGACRGNGADRVTAVVPYLAYSRKDRQSQRRDPVTTRYVAQLFEAAGADCVVTLDVHNRPRSRTPSAAGRCTWRRAACSSRASGNWPRACR
jgi:ribose-phosphate pyrophosphokinase